MDEYAGKVISSSSSASIVSLFGDPAELQPLSETLEILPEIPVQGPEEDTHASWWAWLPRVRGADHGPSSWEGLPQVYGRSSPPSEAGESEASTEVCRRLGVVQGVQAGDSFAAKFEVCGLLGSGAYGAVFGAQAAHPQCSASHAVHSSCASAYAATVP